MKFATTGIFDLHCKMCSYTTKKVDATRVENLMGQHRAKLHGHVVEAVELLPSCPIVGDRVRIIEKDVDAFVAMYGAQARKANRIVSQYDKRTNDGAFLLETRGNGMTIMVRPNQVELAWRDEKERRAGLEEWHRQRGAA